MKINSSLFLKIRDFEIMPVSKFQIDFKNKKAKRGYQWGGKNDSFLISVQFLEETEEVRYTNETFNHFLKLRKYYYRYKQT